MRREARAGNDHCGIRSVVGFGSNYFLDSFVTDRTVPALCLHDSSTRWTIEKQVRTEVPAPSYPLDPVARTHEEGFEEHLELSA